MQIDKPLPLYERVKQHLLTRIDSGEWPDGARLPSEFELMETLGASRMTVHRALREMQADGLIRRAARAGSFVQRRPPRADLLAITDIAEDIAARGHAHRCEILLQEAIRADAAVAAHFGLRQGAKIFLTEIVHYEDETPIQLEDRRVTPLFAPHYLEQDFTRQTTAKYLQSLAPATEVEHVIHAVPASASARNALKIEIGEPCLQLTRRTWTAAGPATRSVLTYPGRLYSFAGRYETARNPTKRPG